MYQGKSGSREVETRQNKCVKEDVPAFLRLSVSGRYPARLDLGALSECRLTTRSIRTPIAIWVLVPLVRCARSAVASASVMPL